MKNANAVVRAVMEVLEPRSLLSVEYTLEVIARSGEQSLTGFGNGPSINDAGTVAFVGRQAVGDGLYVGKGSPFPLSLLSPGFMGDSTRTFNQTAQINNAGQVIAQHRLAGSTIRTFVFVYDSSQVDSFTQIVSGDGGGTGDFQGVFPFPSIDNSGNPVFGALELPPRLLARPSGGGFNTVGVTGTPQPMAADNGTVVAKSGSGLNSPVRLYSPDLFSFVDISQNLFSAIGGAPGISDDGSVIALQGELAFGSTEMGVPSGPGIFINIETAGGRVVQRIIGTSGDGVLDPGEKWTDTNNSNAVDPGEDTGGISSFIADARVGVNKRGSVAGSYNLSFLANNAAGQKSLYVVQFQTTSDPGKFLVQDPVILATAGSTLSGLSGVVTDIGINDPINTNGQVAFWASGDGGQQAIFRATARRKPVFIVPGIVGTYTKNLINPLPWLLNRGVHPDELQIDPLSRVYDDLIQSFKNVGYIEGQDLFVGLYDWRLSPAADDGAIDGKISGLTADSVSDEVFTYGVDYLGYFMRKAGESWQARFGEPLESVHVFAHSTGGLVTRAYIQSDSYGATTSDGVHLPKIDHFIELAVPNRGAALAYGPLLDQWTGDIGLRVLKRTLHHAYKRVQQLGTVTINGPTPITFGSILTNNFPDPVKFIRQYVPTIQALVATYDFVDDGAGGFKDINNDPSVRNTVALDLNNGLDFLPVDPIDPSPFANESNVTVVYGTSEPTKLTVKRKAVGEKLSITTPGPIGFPGLNVLVNNIENNAGDETVPIISGAGQFFGDPRVTLAPFATVPGSPFKNAKHTSIPSNTDVQKLIFRTIGEPISDAQISNGLEGPNLATLSIFIDPVGMVVTDAAGRRIGWSEATGQLSEIPGSKVIGTDDAVGYVFSDTPGSLQGPLTVTLTGMGDNYRAWLDVEDGDQYGVFAAEGFLAQGETKTFTVPLKARSAFAPPTAADDAVATPVSTPIEIDVLANDTDSDGSIVPGTVQIASGASSGTLSVNASTGRITYTPNPGVNVLETFTYTVRDNESLTGSGTVTVTVGEPASPPPPPVVGQAISRFVLVNADTDADLSDITEGMSIDLSTLPTRNISIRVETTPDTASVKFGYDLIPGKFKGKFATNSTAPFTLFGERGADIQGKPLIPGVHKLTAQPFEKKKGKGRKGVAETLNFTLTDLTPTVQNVTLLDSRTDAAIAEIASGSTLTIPRGQKVNIAATTNSALIGSVKFQLAGKKATTDNGSPFGLFGTKASDFKNGTLKAGTYTLSVTPFVLADGKGSAGTVFTISFTVIDVF